MSSKCYSIRGALLRFLIAGVLPAILLLLSDQTSQAGRATWKANPATNDWTTATNWTPQTVPGSGPSDVATFATSNVTSVSISVFIEVDSIVFNPGKTPDWQELRELRSPFTLTASLK